MVSLMKFFSPFQPSRTLAGSGLVCGGSPGWLYDLGNGYWIGIAGAADIQPQRGSERCHPDARVHEHLLPEPLCGNGVLGRDQPDSRPLAAWAAVASAAGADTALAPVATTSPATAIAVVITFRCFNARHFPCSAHG
jgi:hypothetical protein